MAQIVPTSRLGKLSFYEAHLSPWAVNAAALNFSVDQINDITALTDAARAAYTAKEAAADAAKAATEAFYESVANMHNLGSGLISSVKTKAKLDDNPGLYQLAQIPSPADPVPAGDPVAPTALSATLEPGGAIGLSWEGSVAQRQFFSVWRSVGQSQQQAVQIGSVAAKSFIDNGVQRGTEQAIYYVRAQRDNRISQPSQLLVVYFGAVPGGQGARLGGPDGKVIGTLERKGKRDAS
jgi:hypothetical protein